MYFVKGDISINLSQQAQESVRKKRKYNKYKKKKTLTNTRRKDNKIKRLMEII